MNASPQQSSALDDDDLWPLDGHSEAAARGRASSRCAPSTTTPLPKPTLICVDGSINPRAKLRSAPREVERASPRSTDQEILAKRIVIGAMRLGAIFLLAVSLPILFLFADIHWLGNSVGEMSATELSQLTFIALTATAFGLLARFSREDRRFATLAAGFFACMLIRELDAVLDLLFDGLWQGLALSVAATSIAYAAYDWRSTLRGMARLLASRSGMALTIGLALLLAYSRLLGMSALWKGLLEDNYVRIFKNAVEESAELLSYTVIVVASLGYVTNRYRRVR
jgi:hypothetical protein